MKKIILNSLIVTLMGLTQQAMAMTALDDEALSAVDAQALLKLENASMPIYTAMSSMIA